MLGESFKYIASTAGSMGYSMEDTSVALGLMANSGIKASQAGTSLRTLLVNMAKPTDAMQNAMEKLGVSLTDASGNMKPLNAVMGDLRSSFKSLNNEEKANLAATLAGKEGMSGLLAIVNASEEDYNKLTDAIASSSDGMGAAAEMAEKMQDTFQGDVTSMKSKWEGFGITLYDKIQEPARGVVGTLSSMIDDASAYIQNSSLVDDIVGGLSDGLKWLQVNIPKAINAVKPYWDEFTSDVGEIADAAGEAFGAVSKEVGKLDGTGGTLKNFKKACSTVKDVLVGLFKFVEKHADVFAGLIKALPKVVAGFLAFKAIAKVGGIIGGIMSMFGGGGGGGGGIGSTILQVGIAVVAVAGAFWIMAQACTVLSTAGTPAMVMMGVMLAALIGLVVVAALLAPKMQEAGPALIMLGIAVLICAAAFYVMAMAANLLAQGGTACEVMFGIMIAGIAGIIAIAGTMGTQLMQGAIGVLLLGVGLLICAAAMYVMAMAATMLSDGGNQACIMFGIMLVAIVALMAVAAALGPALIIGGVGALLLGVGLLLAGGGALLAAMALEKICGQLPTLAESGASGALAIAEIAGAMTLFAAACAAAGVAAGALALVLVPFTAALVACAAGAVPLAAALKLVQSSLKSIKKDAKSTGSSLEEMVTSVNMVKEGLSAIGDKVGSAFDAMVSAFENSKGKATSSAKALVNGVNSSLKGGVSPARAAGSAIGNGYASGLRSGTGAASAASRALSSAASSALSSARNDAYNNGYWVGQGFANGIRAALPLVQAASAAMVRVSDNTTRNKGRIGSPSRLFHKLGAWMSEGFALGIESMYNRVEDASAGLIMTPDIPSMQGGTLNSNYNYGNGNGIMVVEVPLNVDGRKIAHATASYTYDEMRTMQTRQNRKEGNY
jgi:membrane protein implicated in regulation of membrane protease activity